MRKWYSASLGGKSKHEGGEPFLLRLLDARDASLAAEQQRNKELLAVNEILRADLFAARAEPDAPTDDELSALIKPVWIAAKPSLEAQRIRSAISCSFDDARFREWVSSFVPDYVWDLMDIAAQRGLEERARENESTKPPERAIETREYHVIGARTEC